MTYKEAKKLFRSLPLPRVVVDKFSTRDLQQYQEAMAAQRWPGSTTISGKFYPKGIGGTHT